MQFRMFSLQADRDRVQVAMTQEAETPLLLADVVVNAFRLLAHTPVHAVGLNHSSHRALHQGRADEILDRLAPAAAVDGLLPEIAVNSLNWQAERPDDYAGRLLLTVQPSVQSGWQLAVTAVLAQSLMARMFKVPHHGSDDADEPAVWQSHLRSDAVYAVTRFNNGARSLPSSDDRDRMRSRNVRGHVVGPPSTRRHLHGIVGRRVRAATRDGIWRSTGAVGHYRWRGKLAELTSSTDTHGAVEQI